MPELKITPLNDVAKPGTTPADATSKPVIVGHEAEVADPMVKPEAAPAPAPFITSG